MKLGIVSDEISRDFQTALCVCRQLGIERVEIRNLAEGRAPMCGDAAMAAAERMAHEQEIEITALSPGLFKMTDDEPAFRQEMIEVYPRAAEWAHRWKLPGLLVFGFHKPGATEATATEYPSANPPACVSEWLAEAGERAAADGLVLMIEPEPICWCDSGRATVELIRRAGSGALKINYDPGNVAWLENRDPLDELEVVRPLIANVHVKDLKPLVMGPGFPEWMPAGEGMIDYRAHFKALEAYTGPVSLEPHMGEIGRCYEALKSIIGPQMDTDGHR